MLGAVMYEACVSPSDNSIISPVDSCQMCKKLIINAGIAQIFYRDSKDGYHFQNVADWISDDDSLGTIGY